ncbi:MAG: glycosyltransferase family 9 protein [Deltaproteobacteria bacterium]|nr:glycosyltransferase family 9 protein [Deltaproteobacteria bacterium]
MKRVLIIKTSALGDIAMAAPHVEVICEHHRADEVYLLTGPGGVDLFYDHPKAKTVLLDDSRVLGETSLWGRVRWMRKTGFDVVYDLQGNRTSRRLVRWGRPKVSVGTQPEPVYDLHPPDHYLQSTQKNVFDRLNETLAAGGVAPAEGKSGFAVCPGKRAAVDRWLAARVGDRPMAVFHAGSAGGWTSKRWPRENWLALAKMLDAAGLACVWVGSGPDAEWNRFLAGRVGVDATNRFSPVQVYDLASRARFGVASDSAPMHLFAAAGIPVFAFFGPTSPVRSHALNQGNRTMTHPVPCSPCYLPHCPGNKGHACLAGIGPEAVLSRIRAEVAIP